MKGFRTSIGAVFFGGLAMAAQIADAGPAAPIEGRWAGDRLQLVINAEGGRLEADCASGSFPGPVKIDVNGVFLVAGRYEQYQPGRQLADIGAPKAAARYSGEIKADVMTLSILPEGADRPQQFVLRRGAGIKLIRCL